MGAHQARPALEAKFAEICCTVIIMAKSVLWSVVAAIWQTLLGGALTIAGGFLAVWWQTRRADEVASRIRRAERREDALLRFRTAVMGTVGAVDAAYKSVHRNPGGSTQVWPDVYKAMAKLRDAWLVNASAKIPDQAISVKFDKADRLGRALVPWAYPPPPRNDADLATLSSRFAEDLGILLAQLENLKAEVEQHVNDLLCLWSLQATTLPKVRPSPEAVDLGVEIFSLNFFLLRDTDPAG